MAFWDEEVVLAELEKGAERIYVKRVAKGGRTYIDIRTFWCDEEDEWRPSKKGIAIPVELARDVVAAIEKGLAIDS